MKKSIFPILLLLVAFGVVMVLENKEESMNYLKGKYDVIIEVLGYGEIEAELDADVAPITVTNFINLVENKYYDGSTFNRIIEGFMMQGGIIDKTIKSITGEFEENGIVNTISHVRGTLSMARSDDNNSATSQFFIVQEDTESLDGKYAAFGYVIKGMDIVDEICEDADPIDDNGIIADSEQPVITSIKVVK
jgi:peptidyl-prolyl cis-trans isomerase B (cyclophilin B)